MWLAECLLTTPRVPRYCRARARQRRNSKALLQQQALASYRRNVMDAAKPVMPSPRRSCLQRFANYYWALMESPASVLHGSVVLYARVALIATSIFTQVALRNMDESEVRRRSALAQYRCPCSQPVCLLGNCQCGLRHPVHHRRHILCRRPFVIGVCSQSVPRHLQQPNLARCSCAGAFVCSYVPAVVLRAWSCGAHAVLTPYRPYLV